MKYLGVDWGMKKIGLSISEGMISSPFKTLEVSSLIQAVDQVAKIIHDENIDLVVIGKPEGEMGRKVEIVIKEFMRRGVNIIESDETLSTQQAKQELIALGKTKKKRADDNAQSAAIILQNFLDNQDEKKII